MVEFSGFIGADLLALTGDSVDGNTTIKRQYRDIFDVTALLSSPKPHLLYFLKVITTLASGMLTEKDLARATGLPIKTGTYTQLIL